MNQMSVRKYLLLLKKVIVLTLMISGVALFLLSMYLEDYYFQNAPREPDSASGRVVAYVVRHGTKVFLTEKEMNTKKSLFYFGIPIAMFGMLLTNLWRLWGTELLINGKKIFND
jgi:hypothetical protein